MSNLGGDLRSINLAVGHVFDECAELLERVGCLSRPRAQFRDGLAVFAIDLRPLAAYRADCRRQRACQFPRGVGVTLQVTRQLREQIVDGASGTARGAYIRNAPAGGGSGQCLEIVVGGAKGSKQFREKTIEEPWKPLLRFGLWQRRQELEPHSSQESDDFDAQPRNRQSTEDCDRQRRRKGHPCRKYLHESPHRHGYVHQGLEPISQRPGSLEFFRLSEDLHVEALAEIRPAESTLGKLAQRDTEVDAQGYRHPPDELAERGVFGDDVDDQHEETQRWDEHEVAYEPANGRGHWSGGDGLGPEGVQNRLGVLPTFVGIGGYAPLQQLTKHGVDRLLDLIEIGSGPRRDAGSDRDDGCLLERRPAAQHEVAAQAE